MKKFVIVGAALSGNKGAASMLEATVQTLSKKISKSSFTLLSVYPQADRQLNTLKNLKILSATPIYLALVINPLALLYRVLPPLRGLFIKNPAIRALANADAVLEEGGITFSDGRTVYLLFNIATILPALFLRKPVIKCAQAVGPFNQTLNRLAAKMLLPKMAVIIARGQQTYDNLRQLGLTNIELGADLAFALSIEPAATKSAQPFLKHPVFNSRRTIVGVSPSMVIKKRFDRRGQDYTAMIAQFIDWLITQGYGVVLVPHSARSDNQKTHNNDLPLCRTIYERLKDAEHSCFIDREVTAQTLRYIIGQTDLFVASRFHAMVSALAMGIPTMVIGWSHKYAEVLASFNVGYYALGFANANLNTIKNKFKELVAERNEVQQHIKVALPKIKKLALAHVQFVRGVIE